MEQLKHFHHGHLLHLVHMQWNKKNENSDEEEEDEDEDEDEFVVEAQSSFGECNMCREPIYSFQLCYYQCKECADDYSLHKFCAELPETLENHPSHSSHNVPARIVYYSLKWRCYVCHNDKSMFCFYYCRACNFTMDIVCATISKQKMDHPSHPHQLQRTLQPLVSGCHACGNEHKGTFYHCTTCSLFWIHLNCALFPKKLQIQDTTGGTFAHSHPLTLAYSFPYLEQQARFYPSCRVCGNSLKSDLWHYRCDKCWYYTHVDCATTKKDVWSTSVGKTSKNFEDKDHPNLLRLPFVDESENLLKHHFFNEKDHQLNIDETKDGEILNHDSHQHPLILFDTNTSQLIVADKSLSFHNPMKRNQLLCDGCIRPITNVPVYKCSQPQCGFVLHKWCAHLPSILHDHHPCHPNHTLSLMMPNIPNKLLGVFECRICELASNGFAYGCTTCEYYVDINCAFIPKEITHEAHPNHLLSRIDVNSEPYRCCNACEGYFIPQGPQPMDGFHCRSCEFYVHIECAFLVPSIIRHKLDKHTTLNLRYGPVDNHISEYFCEICENELNPNQWFYHCSICAQSMHAACAPLILHNEQYTYFQFNERCVFRYINVKFGGTLEIMDGLHRLTFVQGVESDGKCVKCASPLQFEMIFKCMESNGVPVGYKN